MRLVVAVLVSVLILVCLSVPATAATALPADRPILIQPMGDSITRGILGADGPNGRDTSTGGYRGTLQTTLTAAGMAVQFVGQYHTDEYGRHSGFNGLTTSRLTLLAPFWLHEHPADIILLLAGTNDLAHEQPAESQMAELLATLAEIVPETLILVAPIPPTTNPSVWSDRVGAYNAATRAEVEWRKASGQRIMWVPMHWSPSLVGDGVHPSEQGYRELADAWATAILGLR